MESNINLQDIDEFKKKHGSAIAGRLLSSLGKQRQFMQAWDTPIGKEILGLVIPLAEEKLDKIINESADDKDKADYRAYMRILTLFRDRINSYYKNLNKIKRG